MVTWIKSKKCGDKSCVEVAAFGDFVLLRDSKNPDKPPLMFSRSDWLAWVNDIKRGQFRVIGT